MHEQHERDRSVTPCPKRRGLIAVAFLLSAVTAMTGAVWPHAPAQAATTIPGQNDGVRVTPMARIVGLGGRTITGFDTDTAGNVFASGYGWDSPPNNRPSRHITTQGVDTALGGTFIVKMAPSGALVWSIPLTGDSVTELEVDAAGNVFAVGTTTDGLVGGVAVDSPGFPGFPHNGPFVAKFKADGSGAVWAKAAPFQRSIGVNPAGTFVYIAAKNTASPLIARIDASSGAVLWQQNFGGNSSPFLETFTDVTVLSDGSPVAAGYFQGDLFLDYPTNTTPINESNGSTIAVRYDINGNRQWFRQIGGTDAFTRTRVLALPDGNLAIAGKSRFHNAQFGGITPPATDYDFAFVTKINATNTNFIWTSFVTTDPTPKTNPNFDLSGIDVDSTGNIVFGTAFEDAAHVHSAYVNGQSNVPAPASVPVAVNLFGDVAVSLTADGAIRFARATENADLPGNEGVQPATREVRFGQGNDVIQAGSVGRPSLIGEGDPNAMSVSPEVFETGAYIARLRIGGPFVLRPPEPPTFVVAWGNKGEQDSTQATVSWKAPSDTGGSPISGYRVAAHCSRLIPGPDIPDIFVTAPANAVRATVPGLTTLVCHWTFYVRASNANGHGPQSEFASLVGYGSDPASSSYRPLANPLRIMDTRDGTGPVPVAKLGPGATIDLFVDRFQTPVYRSRAVALNVTAIFPSQSTHLTVWPRGEPLPATSNLNAPAGSVVPNFVFSKIDADGFITIRNNSGSVDVAIDMLGFYEQFPSTNNMTYEPLEPFRLLDTRFAVGVGSTTPIGPGQKATFPVAGRGGIPTGTAAKAVIVNLTGTGPSAPTHLTLSTSTTSAGGTSNLNLTRGQTAANLAIANVAADGTITVWNNAGSTHGIVDVVGYFHPSQVTSSDPVTGHRYRAISPARALDTRDGTGRPNHQPGKVGPGGVITLSVADFPELQSDGMPIAAVAINVVAAGPSADTHLTVFPGTSAPPVASNLNLPSGGVRANLVVAKLGTDGTIAFRNNSGNVDIVADIVGSFVTSVPPQI